jgi:hypothetical protein
LVGTLLMNNKQYKFSMTIEPETINEIKCKFVL